MAALEELIGNHGGLGGEQTDAFIFHPDDMEVPQTRNTQEVMAILKSRVGLPGETPKPERPAEAAVNSWAPATLGKGLTYVGKWVDFAVHAITLNRDAYRAIARDAYMTGPALLISFLAHILISLNDKEQFDVVNILVRYGVWFVSILFLFLAARVLRGKADFPSTLRVAGFAQSAHILELLGFIPVIGPIARFMALILALFGIWIGTTTAHELRAGARSYCLWSMLRPW